MDCFAFFDADHILIKSNNCNPKSVSANSLNVALNIGFTAALAFDTITRQIDITEFLWLIPVFVAIVILTSLWLNETRKGNRKNRIRKSNKKELKENTIFGINEQR